MESIVFVISHLNGIMYADMSILYHFSQNVQIGFNIIMFKISNKTNLFSFPVIFDSGCSPFIKNGLCSFALSMPKIRIQAKVGDIVAGLATEKEFVRLVFVFMVDEVMPWSEYSRQTHKESSLASRIPHNILDYGDAVYPPDSKYPLPSWAGRTASDYFNDVEKGKNVLLSRQFYYFGKGEQVKINLPSSLSLLLPASGFRMQVNKSLLTSFIDFLYKDLADAKINSFGQYGAPLYQPEFEGFDFIMSCNTLTADADGCGAYVEGRVPLDIIRDMARENDNKDEVF